MAERTQYEPVQGGTKRKSTLFGVSDALRATLSNGKQAVLLRRQLVSEQLLAGTQDQWNDGIETRTVAKFASGGIVIGVVAVLVQFLLVPMHDIYSQPGAWWECMLPCATIYMFFQTLWIFSMTDTLIWRPEFGGPMPKFHFVTIYVPGSVGMIVFWSAMHYIAHGTFDAPVLPFHAFLANSLVLVVQCIVNWRLCSSDPIAKEHALGLIFYIIAFMVILLAYFLTTSAFLRSPASIQIVVAFLYPLLRSAGMWVTKGFIRSIDPSAVIIAQDLVIAIHAIQLATLLGSVGVNIAIVLVGVDFFVNLFDGLRLNGALGTTGLLWREHLLHKLGLGPAPDTNDTDLCKEKRLDALLYLAASLSSMILLPIGFVLCFVVAYSGPNAKLMGGIQEPTAEWQEFGHVPPKDLADFMSNVSILFAANFCAVLINGFLLKEFGIVATFRWAMSEYGFPIAATQGFMLDLAFCALAISCGIDLSFQFSWMFGASP